MFADWICGSCGKDCSIHPQDYYMLRHELWFKINDSWKGMLCMDCVEKRLGRKLQEEDILVCPLTEEINPYTRMILHPYSKIKI